MVSLWQGRISRDFQGAGRLLVLAAAMVALLAGCERKTDPVIQPAAGEASRAAAEGGTTVVRAAGPAWSVALPQRPTVKEDLQALFKGADAGELSFVWEKNGMVVDGADSPRLSNAYFAKGDEISLTATVGGDSRRASTVIVNALPQIIAVPFEDPAIHGGKDIIVRPEALDADGDAVSFRYLWTVNGTPESGNDSPALEKSRFRKGDRVSLQVTPFDGEQEGYPFAGLEFVIPNAPPAFVSEPPAEFTAFDYFYQARATDPDDDPLTYSLETAPAGMSIEPETGRISWKISSLDLGEHRIRVAVQDDEGMKAVQEYTLRLDLKADGAK